MEHAAETGFSRQRGSHHHGFSRGFKSKNPFTFSIAQGIRNNRTPSVQGIDDILLPSRANLPGQPPPRQFYGPPYHQNPYYAPQFGPLPGVVPQPPQQSAPQPVIIQPSRSLDSSQSRSRGSRASSYLPFTPSVIIPQHQPVIVQPSRSRDSSRSRSWRSRRPSHLPYPAPVIISQPHDAAIPEASSHRNRERDRSHSRSPVRYHLPPERPSPGRSYRSSRSRSPIRPRFRSSFSRERSHSFSRGRSRSASHRRSSEIPSRSPHRRSTNSTPAQVRRHRTPESSPGSSPLSPQPPAYSPGDSQEDLRIDDGDNGSNVHSRKRIDSDIASTNAKTPSISHVSSPLLSSIGSRLPPTISSASSLRTQGVPPIVQSTDHTPAFHSVPSAPSTSLYRFPLSRLSTPERDALALKQMEEEAVKLRDYVEVFLTDTLPRQIYLHCLLRLPYLYFSRVHRIFKDADLTLEEIKEMALQASAEDNKTFRNNMLSMGPYYYHPDATNLSPAYQRLKTGWEGFIDNLMREWKTLNLVSVLLLSAIMTIFQIQGASEDPVTRYIAFWSLICALLSLLYGCLFIIRFSSMRKAHKAAEWALEARNSQTTLWNVWVMLAMPVVWLAWSIITYIACIMSFMWRISANLPPDHIFSVSPSTEFGFRIFICIVLGTGIIYGMLIINTFRRYGANMDEAWERRVESYIADVAPGVADQSPLPLYSPVISPVKPYSRRSTESDPTPYVGAATTASFGRRPARVTPVSIPGVPPPVLPVRGSYQSYRRRALTPSPDSWRNNSPRFPSRSSSRSEQRRRTPSRRRTPRNSRSRSRSYTPPPILRRSMNRFSSLTRDSLERGRQWRVPSSDQAADLSLRSSRRNKITPRRTPSPLPFSEAGMSGEIFRPAEPIETFSKESVLSAPPVASNSGANLGTTSQYEVQSVKDPPKSDDEQLQAT